ncbi:MAG TPA: hypothetical protein VF418_12575 [Sphingomonadaceae bacterium]
MAKKKRKVPKRIAGIKLNRTIRRKVATAMALIEVAEAAVIVASFAGAVLKGKKSKKLKRKLASI